MIFIFLMLVLLFPVNSYAGKISAPPVLKEEPIAEQLYFREIYDNFHRLEVVTTNPNNFRTGKKGDMVLFQTGDDNYLQVNVNSAKIWSGAALLSVP